MASSPNDLSPEWKQTESVLHDPAYLQHVLKNVKPNPLTGQIGPDDVLRFVVQNINTPELRRLIDPMLKACQNDQAAAARVDHANIDYGSLPLEDEVWGISVSRGGRLGVVNVPKPDSETEYDICVSSMGVPRYVFTSIGPPDSQTVLRTLKRGMAHPFSVYKPSLPKLLLIPFNMEAHVPVLKPFLDSLPAPFTYRVEDADTRERIEALKEMKAQEIYTQYMRLARKHKDAANAGFKARLREVALAGYGSAIDCALRALEMARDEEEQTESRALLAVCYSNRAATYLLPGTGMETKLARVDAEKAIRADIRYVKGHIRLVRSFEVEGDIPNATKFLKGAMDVPALSQDPLLLQMLQELKAKGGDVVQ